MARFLFVYRGPATRMEDFSPEQAAEQMEAWGKWMAGAGAALADPGAPLAGGTSIRDDGTTGSPGDLNGYTIVQADSLSGAVELTKGHPFLAEGKGRFSIEVFELRPM